MAPDGTMPNVQAVRKLFLGESDPDGTANADAWKNYGFDLDGWSSDAKFGAHCKAIGGAKKADIRIDGKDGIDNSFGKNIVNGIIATLAPNPSDTISESISKGSFTLLIRLNNLGTGKSYSPLGGELLAGSGTKDGDNYVSPTDAQWADGSYVWHPFEELLDTDGKTSKVKFPNSYLVDNTWVSGADKADVPLQLAVGGYVLELTIKHAIIAAKYSDDHKTSTGGNIGGILNTESLITNLKSVAGRISMSLCDGAAFDGIANQIRGASDTLDDGTQDPAKDCSGISVGLGFETANASIGDKAPKAAPSKDPCMP